MFGTTSVLSTSYERIKVKGMETYPLLWWFSKLRRSAPDSASQSLMERSPEAETIYCEEMDSAFTAAR